MGSFSILDLHSIFVLVYKAWHASWTSIRIEQCTTTMDHNQSLRQVLYIQPYSLDPRLPLQCVHKLTLS
jgi:hypothetical protein